MKRFLSFLLVLVLFIPILAHAEEYPVITDEELEEVLASVTDEALDELFENVPDNYIIFVHEMIHLEFERRGYDKDGKKIVATPEPTSLITFTEDGEFFLDEDITQDLIISHFENRGYKIKYALFQPLVEKDDGGLYGGKERWWVTFENGDTIAIWTISATIDYVYDGYYASEEPLF